MIVKCDNCRKLFDKIKSQIREHNYCSITCYKKVHIKNKKRICQYCGNEFLPKAIDRIKYCSRECAYNDHKKWMKCTGSIKKTVICKVCGKTVTRCDNVYRKEYCSRECYLIDTHSERTCKQCGKSFIYVAYQQKYCSKECQLEYHNKVIGREWQRKRDGVRLHNHICPVCSKAYSTMNRRYKYCSKECRNVKDIHDSYKYSKRREYFITQDDADIISKRKVYDRDRGICQLCGMPVNYKWNPKDPYCATVDHIRPLSKGGKHKYNNVQLAHHICNSRKGNKIYG